ncbi:MAG: hypothetical protein WBM02_00485 [bacterium]
MKRQTLKLILIALMVLGIWRAKTAAETGDVKSSKSELKLVYELTLPECITAFSVKKGRDGKNEIDKVLTIAGIYEIDDKKQAHLIKKRTQELPVKTRCYPSSESFSPDGRYVVFDNNPSEYPVSFIIHDFEKRTSCPIDVALFGAFSNRSIMFFARQVPSVITDFSGNIITELPEMMTIKGFENGFICDGMDSNFYFFNSAGQILAKKPLCAAGVAYDIDRKTGSTVLVNPPKSSLLVTDFEGNIKHEFILSDPGYTAGIGISYGGDYAIVVSGNGWIRFFDLQNKKELWKKDFIWGSRFISSSSPVPISENGEYIIIYGDLKITENPTWSMIILNKEGDCVGQIKPPVPRNLIPYYYINFILGTNKIVGFTDNTLSVYEIVERD